MIRVFGYLAWRSAHNRLSRQLRHLRSPRYVVALLLGVAYLWFMVVAQRGPAPASARLADIRWLELVGALVLLGAVAWGWIFGVERRVLTFSPAEVTFLFSGPVSRRGLIQFKLLRSQLFILFNALLWTLILSRERFGISPWLRVVSIWVLLTTLSLHRLGASFVRTSLAEHGRLGLRHRVVSLSVLAVVLVALGLSIADALPYLADRGGDFFDILPALGEAGAQPLPSALTYPFRIMIRPLLAESGSTWLSALWPAVILMLVHYVWVLRSDTAFEEAAAEVSLQRAQTLSDRRTGRIPASSGAPVRVTPPLFRLAPGGWPAGAILWKNLVAVTRTRRVRNVALALAVGGGIVAVLSFEPEGILAAIAGWFAVTWAAAMIVIGPQWVRNDLRGDLLKLDLLRSYPLRGWSIVIAEVSASALVLTLIQVSLLLIGYLAFLGDQLMEPALEERTLLLLAALVFLPPINLLGMLIQNGAALLYPAWVRLGSGRPGGVEALGQNVLMMVAYVALLTLILVLPVVIGGGTFLLLRPSVGDLAAVPATALTLATMAFEAALIVDWLGRLFELTDPAAAGIGGS